MLRIPSLKSSRGTAEIETLLVIPLLLAILFLAGGELKLGSARLANVFHAENHAYAEVIAGTDITPSADPVPFTGIASVRPAPALPTRFDLATAIQVVPPIAFNNASRATTLQDQAIFLDPTWHYTPWPASPAPGDQSILQSWFESYIEEDHPPTLTNALGLKPAWPP